MTHKEQIAEMLKVDVKILSCYHCANWGWNRGKVMNSMCESRCACRKERTACNNYCKKFQEMEGKK